MESGEPEYIDLRPLVEELNTDNEFRRWAEFGDTDDTELISPRSFRMLLQSFGHSSIWGNLTTDEDGSSLEVMSRAESFHSPSINREMSPNTSRMDKSELSLETKQACGYYNENSKENISVTSMIQKRILGPGFTNGQKCRINNYFLPNMNHQIVKYSCKAFCGSHSEDGSYLLTASQDRFLRLYHAKNGKLIAFKKIPARDVGSSILDTAFSPDGRYIVYSSWSECLYMCSVNGDPSLQDALWLYPGDRRFCIFSLVFSNDGKEIIGSANDGHLYVYDLREHQRTLRIKGHSRDANAVTFADNTSQILFSGGDDGLCKVWDRRTLHESNPQPVGVLAGHKDGITYIDTRGDGRHLITNSKDQTIKLWDMRAFSDKKAEENTRLAVDGQDWDYRWQQVPMQLYKSTTLLEGDTSIMTYRGHSVLQTLIRCHFSPAATTGQRYIYTGCAKGNVKIYDVLTGKRVTTLQGHEGCVRDVSWHPYHQQIISTSWDGLIMSWDYSSKCLIEQDSDDDSDTE